MVFGNSHKVHQQCWNDMKGIRIRIIAKVTYCNVMTYEMTDVVNKELN